MEHKMTKKELIEKLNEFDGDKLILVRIDLKDNMDYLDYGHVFAALKNVRLANTSYKDTIVLEGSLR